MVAEWILPLAEKGGAALVAAAATDTWQSARSGIVKLFHKVGPRRQKMIEVWLDDAARVVAEAGPSERPRLRSELTPIWQQRMADLLTELPEVREDLEAWADRVQHDLPMVEQKWVQANIAGRDAYAVQHGSQHFYRTGESPAGEKLDRSAGQVSP